MAIALLLRTRRFCQLTRFYSSNATNSVGFHCIPAVTMATSQKSIEDIFHPPVCTLADGEMLNRDLFLKTIILPAIRFNRKLTKVCLKALKSKAVAHKPFLKNSPSDPEEKVLLLNPEIVSSDDVMTLGEAGTNFLQEHNLEGKFGDFPLELKYSDWTSDEVLRSLLPEGVEVPTGFSRIGHIAHLNLRPEQLKYKCVIGEVLMDKNPGLKTVVNKTGEINNEFRFFNMELLAGENNMITTTKEHGHSFKFDFSKVYWNPRLSTEHTRILGMLNKGDVVYDMFAGVGPFAVPAAKKGCSVFANDLNPESFKWLEQNVKLNKIKTGSIRTYNLDGREFIRDIASKDLVKRAKQSTCSGPLQGTHVIMNLPSLAIEFLAVFSSLLPSIPTGIRDHVRLPTVHCYCFSKEVDIVSDVRRRIEAVLSCSIEGALIHAVRNVAPNKEMMCVSFKLPAPVIFGCNAKEDINEATEAPPSKKPRTE